MVGLLINHQKHVVLNLNIFGTDLNPLALTLNNPTVPRASLSGFLVDTTAGRASIRGRCLLMVTHCAVERNGRPLT